MKTLTERIKENKNNTIKHIHAQNYIHIYITSLLKMYITKGKNPKRWVILTISKSQSMAYIQIHEPN